MTSKKTGLYVCIALGALLCFQVLFTGLHSYGTEAADRTVVEAKATAVDLTAGIIPEVAEQIEAALELKEVSSLEFSSTDTLTSSLDMDFILDGAAGDGQHTGVSGPVSPYANIVLPDVKMALNIRANGSETAAVVGKLYRGTSAEILETAGQWTKIRSGSIEGWVMNDYIVSGAEAEAMIAQTTPKTATVTANTLRMREEASTKSYVLAEVTAGEQFVVISETEEWAEIIYTSKVTGFVSKEYVTIEAGTGIAVSKETENARTEINEKYERLKAVEEAKARAKELGYSIRTGISCSAEDIYLIAAVCDYEAGSGSSKFEGQLAVANVIVSRVKSGKWGSSVHDVVYAPGQFSGVRSGSLQKALDRGPSASSMKAAEQAVAGINNVGNYMFFCSLKIAKFDTYRSYVIIGGDCFYQR